MFLKSLNIFSIQNKDIFSNSLLISFFGLLIIFFLLIFGRKFKLAVQLERFGLPIAVISGILGISIGPFGAIHFLPKETINVWSNFPTPLLSSSILGSIFIFLGRTFGLSDNEEILEQKENLKEKKIEILADLKIFIINLGFSGLAISFGVLLLKYLRYISSPFGDFSKEIIFSLPVFPFILIGSLLIRYILELSLIHI